MSNTIFDYEMSYINKTKKWNKTDTVSVETVLESSIPQLRQQIGLDINDPKILGLVFDEFHQEIVNMLARMREHYKSFSIKICNRVEIGYDFCENDFGEKSGNILIYYTPLHNKSNMKIDMSLSPSERLRIWNNLNQIVIPKLDDNGTNVFIKALVKNVYKKLENEYKITFGDKPEVLIPIFSLVLDNAINYVKTKRQETDEYEYSINLFTLTIAAQENVDDDDNIIEDLISMRSLYGKYILKDDTMTEEDD